MHTYQHAHILNGFHLRSAFPHCILHLQHSIGASYGFYLISTDVCSFLVLFKYCGKMSEVWLVECTNALVLTCACLSVPSALESYQGELQLTLIGVWLPQLSAVQPYLQLPTSGQEIHTDRSLLSSASRKKKVIFFLATCFKNVKQTKAHIFWNEIANLKIILYYVDWNNLRVVQFYQFNLHIEVTS